MIYIGNVKMEPLSTREELWQFARLEDAREFARISFRRLWVAIPGDPFVYRVWPGGRLEKFTREYLKTIGTTDPEVTA